MTDRDRRRVAILLALGLALLVAVAGGATTGSVLSDSEEVNATFSVGNVTVSSDTVGSGDGTPTPGGASTPGAVAPLGGEHPGVGG